MRTAGSILGLVIVLAIVWFVLKSQFSQGPRGAQPPAETIDVVGVKSDLLAIAQAEKIYMASHGNYASLDDLQKDGALTFSGANRRGYTYSVAVADGEHFTVTGRPSDPSKSGWPTLSIDDTMQETQQ